MITMIEEIVNKNIEKFGNSMFVLGKEADEKYANLFKRGKTTGESLGIFFLRDPDVIINLIKYYSDFEKNCDLPIINVSVN